MIEIRTEAGDAADEGRKAALQGLRDHNRPYLGDSEGQVLVITARDGEEIVGAAYGSLFGTWLSLHYLWIAESHRARRLGAQLLQSIEAEANRLGATRSMLDTFSFQSPGFYIKAGYTEWGRIEDYAPGHARHYFQKFLVPPNAEHVIPTEAGPRA